MADNLKTTKSISLEKEFGITNAKVHYQLSPSELHQATLDKNQVGG